MKRRLLYLTSVFAFFSAALIQAAVAQDPWDWWPDPATHRGISAWISYSSNYDTLWSNRTLVDQEVASIAQSGVEVVFLAISSSATRPHLQRLADQTDPFTSDVQYVLDRLVSMNIRACASILSDTFTGSDTQMQRFVLVDYLLGFNASRGPDDSGFTCVATDLERLVEIGVRRQFVRQLQSAVEESRAWANVEEAPMGCLSGGLSYLLRDNPRPASSRPARLSSAKGGLLSSSGGGALAASSDVTAMTRSCPALLNPEPKGKPKRPLPCARGSFRLGSPLIVGNSSDFLVSEGTAPIGELPARKRAEHQPEDDCETTAF